MTESEIKTLLEEVEQYCSKATPGPWTVELCNSGESCWCRVLGCKDDGYGNDYLVPSGSIRKKDAEFAARARTDLPKLAALLREKLEGERWIAVSERLPEVEADVLVAYKSGMVEIGFLGEDKAWYTGDWERIIVTHWRPLPDAPEVQG